MTPSGPAGARRGARRGRALVSILAWVAIAIAAVVALRMDQRVEHDAALCATSCHHDGAPASGEWHAGGHAGTECQQCHAVTTGTAWKLLAESIVRPSRPTPHGKATAAACVACHEKQPAEWRLVAETQGHRQHRDVAKIDCLSCHASDAHAPDAPEKRCLSCHADQRLHKDATRGAETCLSCHSFASTPKNARPPTTIACEKCHDGAQALASSGLTKDVNARTLHGGVACQLCHNAHGDVPKAPAGQPICARCHQFENFQIGGEDRKGPEGHRNCEGCHKPHAPLKSAIQGCVTCHEKNAKGLVAAMAPGKTTALKHESCASCHLPHTWKAERSGCMQCHKDEARLLTTRSPPQHESCTSCHEVHGPPPTGAVCLKCHSDTKGKHVALAPERHKDCTSCHDPHAPKPEDTRTSCAKCHTTELTQVMSLGPEGHVKESCFGCHQPHESPLPKPDACAKCHAERAKIVATAPPPKHRVCTSCHEKHVFKIEDPKVACAKCHGPMFDAAAAGVSWVPHDRDCKTCHTLHGPPGITQASCLQCHDDVKQAFDPPNPTHATCRSCHQPHTPAATAPAKCRTCHADKAAIAAKWPAESAHAKQCNNCHQPHDVREKKACGQCHAEEAASAVGSKHQCKQCHAPHAEPPGTGAAWWTRCAQCHADKAASVKERGPTHSECKHCHQQHRFAVPECTTCHADIATKGIHANPNHLANCTKCHDPHVRSLPTPQQCLACHVDRKNHEPNAQRCQACHTFR
jgi:hypothetical protein